MASIGTSELLLIFFVVLLVFGAKRIPEIARHMGTALREFRTATRELSRQLDLDATHQPPPPARPRSSHTTSVAPPPAPSSMGDDPHLAAHREGVAGKSTDERVVAGFTRSDEVNPL